MQRALSILTQTELVQSRTQLDYTAYTIIQAADFLKRYMARMTEAVENCNEDT